MPAKAPRWRWRTPCASAGCYRTDRTSPRHLRRSRPSAGGAPNASLPWPAATATASANSAQPAPGSATGC